MAFGTPVAATAAYSAAGGTSVSPSYPSGITSTDQLLLIVGQKPSTANSGTVSTPSGWTLREELTAAGGYSTTLGADTGNTNLRFYTKDTVTGSESGTLTVTVGTNNVCWAFILRVPTSGGAISYGSTETQKTGAGNINHTFAADPGLTAGDIAIWAMCIPTDAGTPTGFSSHTISASGATFNTATELNEPDSATGNDIGGFSAWATVSSGTATVAPTITSTVSSSHNTNARGPIILLRMREAVPDQDLTPSRFDNSQTFHGPTVTPFSTLAPSLFTNSATFHAATVENVYRIEVSSVFFDSQSPFDLSLTPSRYDEGETFYAATVAPGAVTLTPALYADADTFGAATVAAGAVTLTLALLTDDDTFYAATVSVGGVTLTPALVSDADAFGAATVTAGAVALQPALVTDGDAFGAATVAAGAVAMLPALYADQDTFYAPLVGTGGFVLAPDLYQDADAFYGPAVAPGAVALAPTLVEDGDAFYGPSVAAVGGGAQSLLPTLVENTPEFPAATVEVAGVALFPGLVESGNEFFQASVSSGDGGQHLLAERLENVSAYFAAAVASSGQAGGAWLGPWKWPAQHVQMNRPRRVRDEEICIL